MKKKRKYVRKQVTDALVIKRITSIRTKNNKLWMEILRLAFASKKREAKRIMQGIVENDQKIFRLMSKLGTAKRKA